MRKVLSKIMAVMLTIVIVVGGLCVKTEAASYPSVFFFSDEKFNDLIINTTANVGDIVNIRMEWFAEYNNEGYDLVIYNSNDEKVFSESDTWTNASYQKHITVYWNTTGLPSGDYTVEVTKKFYSLYRWNEAPTKSHLYITLTGGNYSDPNVSTTTKNPSKVKIKAVLKTGKKSVKVIWKKAKNAKKYNIQYSTSKKFNTLVKNKNTKKQYITLKKLKKGKKYYFRVRAINKNIYGQWSKVKKIKIK